MEREIGKKKKSAVSGTKKKVTHRRKRRVSGVGNVSGMLQKAGGLVVGAVAGRELNTLGVKLLTATTFTPMISGIAQMAAGYFLPKFVKGAFVQAMGDGMIANGGMVLIVSTGMITGTNDRMAYRINGLSNLKAVGNAVNGLSTLKAVGNAGTRIQNSPPVMNGAGTRIQNSVPRAKLTFGKR